MSDAGPDDAGLFARLLTPAPLGEDRFAGGAGGGFPRRTFGGLLAGQALAAAAATAGGRPCHSFQLLFLDAGDADAGVEVAVRRLREGRSFSAREIDVEQGGRLLIRGLASFHAGDAGPAHAIAMPDAPAPESIEVASYVPLRPDAHRRFIGDVVLDLRVVEPAASREANGEARRQLWFRTRDRLPDDPAIHQAAIAFASDLGLVHVGLQAHPGERERLQVTSLDHSLRFHAAARADEWMLFEQRSPVAADGRGLGYGAAFARDGRLIATTSQEFLARYTRSAG